jgi:aryl-alcohol dehydrogenase-like predicted oxidoreductase
MTLEILVDLLRVMADETECSVSQLALAWCAAQPGITAPIIGPRTLEQVTDNLGATDVRLESADLAKIDELVPPCSAAVRYYDRAMGLDLRAHPHRNLI